MKKIVLAITLMLICAVSVFPVSAEFVNPPIVDEAGYLTDGQFEELSARLDQIRTAYNFDVAIYTEEIMSGFDAESTADDLFDYKGYGAGQNEDGILLYICADTREYWFTTHGSGEAFFNQNGLAYLEKEILPFLKENDYASAMTVFAQRSEELLEMAKQGKPFDQKQHSAKYLLCVIAGALLLPLLLAFLLMQNKLGKMKTAVKQDYAANYMKPGSMNLTDSRDIFLYSTVTKTEKPKSNSDSHTSSSGESHGGRGGSF